MRILVEQMTRENPREDIVREGQKTVSAVWTVKIWYRSAFGTYPDAYYVQGTELHTGAKVPAEEPRVHNSLGAARKDARELLALLAGKMLGEPWIPE